MYIHNVCKIYTYMYVLVLVYTYMYIHNVIILCDCIALFSSDKVDLEDLSNERSSWIPVKNTVTRKDFVLQAEVVVLALVLFIVMCVGTPWLVSVQNELNQLKSYGCPVATSEFNYTELVQVQDDMSARIHELELHEESLQENLNHTRERLNSAKIEIALLESELSTVTAALEGLETTSKSDLDSLSDNFTLLVSQKADKTELAGLASNLSTLAATTVHKTYFEIWVVNITAEVREMDSKKADRDEVARLAEDLAALADSALNGSHYDQLSSDIETLAVNTASNLSSLREDIHTLNETKTPRVDFLSLVRNVTAISNAKVDKSDFDSLVVTVESLEATKADQTSLNSLTDDVDQLAATASDLHTLHNTVTSHINSAQNTHNQHSSQLNNIDNKVRANSDDINRLSHNIDNLQTQVNEHSSSAQTFPPQWATVLLLTLSCLYIIF